MGDNSSSRRSRTGRGANQARTADSQSYTAIRSAVRARVARPKEETPPLGRAGGKLILPALPPASDAGK